MESALFAEGVTELCVPLRAVREAFKSRTVTTPDLARTLTRLGWRRA